ncbi:sensor histidine kinase [Lysobacter sp. A3-1-A15]|uniref:sensor histidine kinase n=1 Tax=Novilysobacter viscosus TaxID=3098602 RepID=UPI002EDB2A71
MSPTRKSWLERLAHDLRGPLSPVQTAVFLLRDERTPPADRAELLDVIDRQTRRLGRMIEEVSDFVRADKGRLLVRRESVDLELLLDDIGPRLREMPPEITFEPGASGITLHGDVVRLGQLMRAVLGFQMSPADAATPRATIRCLDGGRMQLVRELACRGDAAAMAAGLLGDPHPEPGDDGLGLQMMIAHAIALAHGGELTARARGDDVIELDLQLPAGPTAAA